MKLRKRKSRSPARARAPAPVNLYDVFAASRCSNLIKEYTINHNAKDMLSFYIKQKFPWFTMKARYKGWCIACFERIVPGAFISCLGNVKVPYALADEHIYPPNSYTELKAYINDDGVEYEAGKTPWVHAACKFNNMPNCMVCNEPYVTGERFYIDGQGAKKALVCGECKRWRAHRE